MTVNILWVFVGVLVGAIIGGMTMQVILTKCFEDDVAEKVAKDIQKAILTDVEHHIVAEEQYIKNVTISVSPNPENPQQMDISWIRQNDSVDLTREEYKAFVQDAFEQMGINSDDNTEED